MKFSYSCEKTHTINGTEYAFKPDGERFTCDVSDESHIEIFLNNECFEPVNARQPKVEKKLPRKQGTIKARSAVNRLDKRREPRK